MSTPATEVMTDLLRDQTGFKVRLTLTGVGQPYNGTVEMVGDGLVTLSNEIKREQGMNSTTIHRTQHVRIDSIACLTIE